VNVTGTTSRKSEGTDTDTDKDLEEYDDTYIINELMRRLGLCRSVSLHEFIFIL
jgi:hypothetical protein